MSSGLRNNCLILSRCMVVGWRPVIYHQVIYHQVLFFLFGRHASALNIPAYRGSMKSTSSSFENGSHERDILRSWAPIIVRG